VPYITYTAGFLPKKAANIAKTAQRFGFQRNNHIREVRCNELFFRDLKEAKKGLM